MTRLARLGLIGVLVGALGLIGCGDDDTPSNTGGSGGSAGSGGSGGSAGDGGNGGSPPVMECGEGEEIDDSYTTATGLVECDGLGVLTVPIEVTLAAKTDGAPAGDAEVDTRIQLTLSEETVELIRNTGVTAAPVAEASADVADNPETLVVNVATPVPCEVDFTIEGPLNLTTPQVIQTWPAIDGSIVLVATDITLNIPEPVPLVLSTKEPNPACVWMEMPTITLE